MATDWDPVRDLRNLRERVDTLFQDVLGRAATDPASDASGAWRPPVDAWEDGDAYVVRADLPGVAPGDVTIEVESGVVHVRGDRLSEPPVTRDALLRAERPHGRFGLALTIPPSVDPHGIEARQKDGVLEIVFRKRRGALPGRVRIELK
ncbi:MAG TPA: Hsp20/alpha crystallin family protein [Candidatus Polarisedimenticolaceae bacterium]|nr:Hsp20/alpha crystallin family protein [Candidatus Polarisedimenticolaceae bacterium]